MSSESPAVILYSSAGVEISANNGATVASSAQPGVLIDGYNYATGLAQLMAVDSSGHSIVVGSGVAGTPAGGVLTIQGSASMTALTVNNTTAANLLATVTQGPAGSVGASWFTQITDATHGPVAVKAASTAAVAADQSLVVSLSPNNAASGSVTTAAPTYTTGTVNALSLDTSGNLRVTGSINNSSVSATATATPGFATLSGGAVTTVAPTYTTGQMDPLSLTTAGLLRIDGVYPVNATTPTSDIAFVGGAVTTAAPTYTTGQLSALSLTTAGALRVDGSAVTQPVSGTVTANAGTGNFNVIGTGTAGTAATGVVTVQGIAGGTALPVSISGTISTVTDKSTTGTMTSVAGSITSVTLLASNANRIGATFYNDGSSILYLALSATAASLTAFSIRILPNSYYDLPITYVGQVNGIFSTTNSTCRITELT